MVDLVVLAAIVFAFGLVSRRLEGTVLTAPLLFVAAGVLLGPAALGLVEFKLDYHTVLLLAEIALAIVLFSDAARTNLSTLRQNEGLPLRLLGIGDLADIWSPTLRVSLTANAVDAASRNKCAGSETTRGRDG